MWLADEPELDMSVHKQAPLQTHALKGCGAGTMPAVGRGTGEEGRERHSRARTPRK